MFEFSEIPWKKVYLVVSVTTTVLSIAAYPVIRMNKRRTRKCICCGCKDVTRTHQLLRNKHEKNDGRHYHSYTFAECSKCGHFWLAKSADKCFSDKELWWRRKFKVREFVLRPELFKRAGLPLPDFKVEILATNIRHSRIPILIAR